MYYQVIKNLLVARSWRAADLARAAKVSRAAVSKWIRSGEDNGWVNVETSTLRDLAENLNVSPAVFLSEQLTLEKFRTQLLWDHLYESVEAFLLALAKAHEPALARLVQILGFHKAQCIAGEKVITLFPQYKHIIKPVRRKELESVWHLYQ